MNIFIAGHRGMVGSSILRKLKQQNDTNIITCSRKDLDFLSQDKVNNFFAKNEIEQVYLAAAKVGGIYANNTYPAEFIYENLMIEANIINASHITNVSKLLFLGSSCIYPKYAEQPIKEESLLTGLLEQTNEPYAIAKIAGIKLCESYNRQYDRDYRSVMPTNLYGPNDNFHSKNSHVIPALIKRFHTAVIKDEKEVTIWGTGGAMREFLHVDDMADACIHIMNLDKFSYNKSIDPHLSHINIGTGIECSIKALAENISTVTEYKGEIIFDSSYPDGTPRKLLDTSKINNMNWQHSIDLVEGLKDTYNWYKENIEIARQ